MAFPLAAHSRFRTSAETTWKLSLVFGLWLVFSLGPGLGPGLGLGLAVSVRPGGGWRRVGGVVWQDQFSKPFFDQGWAHRWCVCEVKGVGGGGV